MITDCLNLFAIHKPFNYVRTLTTFIHIFTKKKPNDCHRLKAFYFSFYFLFIYLAIVFILFCFVLNFKFNIQKKKKIKKQK